MKVVNFKGGLGNQMFQYAFLRRLETQFGINDIYGDFSFYAANKCRKPDIFKMNVKCKRVQESDLKNIFIFKSSNTNGFDVNKNRIQTGLEALFNRKYFFEKSRDVVNLSKILNYHYYDGYWQSWQYLEGIENLLREEFMPVDKLNWQTIQSINKYEKINSVFVGVRRGDYFADKKSGKHYGETDLAYYKNAIRVINSRLENPVFIFFSNDIEWVKKNMQAASMNLMDEQIIYREKKDIYDDFEELFVMGACRNAIISNSTFNFWGAWLIDNSNKIVIAPKQWFKDNKTIEIIPPGWIKI